jgi:hypothetical protein
MAPRHKRTALTPKAPTARSRVSNGKATFLKRIAGGGQLGNTVEARRFVDVLQTLVADLGGRDDMSEAQYQVARRCAALAVRCELDEALMVAGQPVNMDAFGRNASRLGRELQRLGFKGLRRRPKDVTPSVRAYAREHAQEAST